MEIRRAQLDDIESLQSLFSEAVRWQKSRGVPTFAEFSPVFLEAEIKKGRVYLAFEGDDLVGTVSIYESDDVIWEGVQEPSLYVHRLASARAPAGRGVGSALIRWAKTRARESGKVWLRVDCWAENKDLCDFYQKQGFRIVCDKGTGSNPSLPPHYQNIQLTLFEMSSGLREL